jgi:hypothetical protein
MRVITLTTDFGTRDYYVGTMKGVIFRIAPLVHVVDLTHEIEKHDIAEAAIVVRSSRSFFPPGTVHVAVVDPGVGGSRRPVLVRSADQFYVGPDNGIFSFVLDANSEAWEIASPEYRLDVVSDTFHGRDIFAPAAAHLVAGVSPDDFGPRVDDLARITTRPPSVFPDRIQGEVIHVDSFGNLITNVSRDLLDGVVGEGTVTIEVSGRIIDGVSRTYSEAPRASLMAVFGSTDLLELAVRDGSAHRKLGVGRGDPVRLTIGR